MAKPTKDLKPKSLKDQRKELEARLFGEKNSSKKKEIQGLIKKLEIAMKLETEAKKKQEAIRKSSIVRQVIPVGVDPKTVMCINFQNGNCEKGTNCQFAHELKKTEVKKVENPLAEKRQRMVCRFLIDALNSGEYTKNWVCPLPNCFDIHKLLEIGGDSTVEVSLEEYIELQRQTIDDTKTTPITEEVFKAWKAKKDKEEELHAQRVAVMSGNSKGIDLFKLRPEIFEDDAEADDEMNYGERDYDGMISEESEIND